MISYVVEVARMLSADGIILVTGHGNEEVEAYLKDEPVTFVLQAEQKGTAHALLCAKEHLRDADVLVLYGDVPLVRAETLVRFREVFDASDGIVFMTTEVDNPAGYGRIVKKGDEIREIVEDVEASAAQKTIREINTGICMIRSDRLSLTEGIGADNRKGEYYLTDICTVAGRQGVRVKAFVHSPAAEVLGINNRRDLLEANRVMRDRILDFHMDHGVTILDRNVYIEAGVAIGKDSVICPSCVLSGKTVIGEAVRIGPFAVIDDSILADHVVVEAFSAVDGVTLEEGVSVGPFARLRPATS